MLKTLSNIKFCIIVIASIVFIIYGHSYPFYIKKPMLDKNITINFNLWSLTHFLLFFYFGRQFPKKLLLFTFYGILWEFLEDYLAKDSMTKLVDCKKKKNHIWCKGNKETYWNAKYDDILINIFGFLLGSYISCSSRINLKTLD